MKRIFVIVNALILSLNIYATPDMAAYLISNSTESILLSSLIQELRIKYNANFEEYSNVIPDNLTFHIGDNFISIMSNVSNYKDTYLPLLNSSKFVEDPNNYLKSNIAYSIHIESKPFQYIEMHTVLTKIVEFLIERTNSIGIYWPNSCQLLDVKYFSVFSKQLINGVLPWDLWVNLFFTNSENSKTVLHSIGFYGFGYPEIEIINLKKDWNYTIDYLYYIFSYLTTNDIKIKEKLIIKREKI